MTSAGDRSAADGGARRGRLSREIPPELAGKDQPLPRHERAALVAQSRLLPKGGRAKPPKPNRVNPRMAMYLRVSHLAYDSVSIARQYAECIDFIESKGGLFDPFTDLYKDEGISASKGLYRPRMEAMLRRVEEGAYDGVVVWEVPRALRNYAESLNFVSVLTQASCEFYAVTLPSIGLWGPGLKAFENMVEYAAEESKSLSLRQLSRYRYLEPFGAAKGRPVFGMKTVEVDVWVPGRQAPLKRYVPDREPREGLGGRSPAELVAEAIDLVLEGRSCRSIAMEWNALGYDSVRSARWGGTTLSAMMLSPSQAGLAHRGGRPLGLDGEPLPPGSTDEPLKVSEGVVDVATWMQLHRVFDNRSRSPRSDSEPILRGLVRCGRCGSTVGKQSRRYGCEEYRIGSPTCGRSNTMQTPRLEKIVLDAAMDALKARDRREESYRLNQPDRREDVARCEARLAESEEELAEAEILWIKTKPKNAAARGRFDRHRRQIAAEAEEVRSELRALTAGAVDSQISKLYTDDRTVEEEFWAAPRHLQVSVLHELIDHVLLHGANSTRFDESRVEIVWR